MTSEPLPEAGNRQEVSTFGGEVVKIVDTGPPDFPTKEKHDIDWVYTLGDPHPIGGNCSCGAQLNVTEV